MPKQYIETSAVKQKDFTEVDHTPRSDRDLLALLQSKPQAELPATVTVEHDPLGLVNHEHIREQATEHIYDSFSFITEQAARNNPEVRQQLLQHNGLVLPNVRVGEYNEFGLRWESGPAAATFVFSRQDKGNSRGGFILVKTLDGSIIIKREDNTPAHDGEEEAQLIHQARMALLMYATKLNVSTEVLQDQQYTDHLTDEVIQDLAKQAKKEKTKRHKVARKVGSLARNAVGTASLLVTTNKDDNGEIHQFGKRRLSKVRIAALALVLPVPGYSSHFFDTPVPRPASVEMAADSVTSLTRTTPKKIVPNYVHIYDTKEIDLPDSARLTMGTTEKTVFLAKTPRIPSTVSPIQIGPAAINGHNVLTGDSPRLIKIEDSLAPNDCEHLPADPAIQSRNYRFGSTDSVVAENTTVAVTPAALYVCNSGTDILSSDQLKFYFDTTPH